MDAMRVTLLVADDEQEQTVVGSFVLEGSGPIRIETDSEDPDAMGILRETLAERLFVHMSNPPEWVTADGDPELWMRELPYKYNGYRVRAALEE